MSLEDRPKQQKPPHCPHHEQTQDLNKSKSTIDVQIYTCPMHPEVIRDNSGSCPICGMALEPKMISKDVTVNTELRDFSKRFWISVILTVPILILTMGVHISGLSTLIQLIPLPISAWVQFILTTIVTFWCGFPLLIRGIKSLQTRRLNMFTLIALGTTIAYGYSVIAFFFPQLFPTIFRSPSGQVGLYFESAAVITALVLMGQVLELKGREKTGNALRALLNLSPKTARRISGNNEEDVPLEAVKPDDELRVRPGELIPTDGELITGHTSVNEAMITGESIPVEKVKGSKVIGGTLNIAGSFIMRAERVGAETMLAQIIKLVSESQRSRAPIQKLADYLASYFVPIVIIIALITFFIWSLFGPSPAMTYGIISAVSVLIIACPCALGLATPMSIVVGMGRGAQAGILIKDAESLEQFAKVNVLVIDKTGTMTAGKPIVEDIVAVAGFDQQQILLLAASLENMSEHPLANAIVTAAVDRSLDLQHITDFSAEVGKGVTGKWQEKQIALGNTKLLEAQNVSIAALEKQANAFREEGKTVVFVVIENKLVGLISVSDPIKKSTFPALDWLKKNGIDIVMVTGDNAKTAKVVANKLGIKKVEAEVLPQEKSVIVKNLQSRGFFVAMAGDGINDAPALAQANVGIAMGTGTDVALQSAGIVLVKGDLMAIVRARQLSKKVMRNIRENLFLAFIYNIVCIPIAAGVLFPWTKALLDPMIAALAMSLSSISVIANALRLRYLKLF